MTHRKIRPLAPTFTKRNLIGWGPCWTRARINRFLDLFEDEPWTALDVLMLPNHEMDVLDREWVAMQMMKGTEAMRVARAMHERRVTKHYATAPTRCLASSYPTFADSLKRALRQVHRTPRKVPA